MRRFRDHNPYADGNSSGVTSAAPTNCTFRSFTPPEPLVPLRRNGYPTGVVIQADGDPATQYNGGPAMAAALNNQLISIRDSGEHGHYSTNPCVTTKINNYLINSVIPPSRSECAAEPRPPIPPDSTAHSTNISTTKEARIRTATEHHSIWP